MTTMTLCYIENDDKFLMLHRVKKQDDMNEGKWIGVGGHVKAMVPNLPAWEGDQVFLDLLLSGEKRFFSVKLQYEGDRLVEKKIYLY